MGPIVQGLGHGHRLSLRVGARDRRQAVRPAR